MCEIRISWKKEKLETAKKEAEKPEKAIEEEEEEEEKMIIDNNTKRANFLLNSIWKLQFEENLSF